MNSKILLLSSIISSIQALCIRVQLITRDNSIDMRFIMASFIARISTLEIFWRIPQKKVSRVCIINNNNHFVTLPYNYIV